MTVPSAVSLSTPARPLLRLSCSVSGENVTLPTPAPVPVAITSLMSKSKLSISNQPAWCASVEPPLSPSMLAFAFATRHGAAMTLAVTDHGPRALGAVHHDWTREEVRALFALPFPELIYHAQRVHRLHFDPTAVQMS